MLAYPYLVALEEAFKKVNWPLHNTYFCYTLCHKDLNNVLHCHHDWYWTINCFELQLFSLKFLNVIIGMLTKTEMEIFCYCKSNSNFSINGKSPLIPKCSKLVWLMSCCLSPVVMYNCFCHNLCPLLLHVISTLLPCYPAFIRDK